MRPAPPKDRVKMRPGPPKPSRLSTLSSSTSLGNDSIKLLEKDLQIVTKKLVDLKNLPNDDGSSVRNGIGLSNSAPTMSNEEAIKFQLTEKIMGKLTEIDREVLNKTGDTLISRARRSSRDSLLGSDLSCMPAHMTLVDRLIDFHVLIKRNEASSVQTTSLSRQNSRSSTPNDSQEDVSKYKLLVQQKDQEILKLKTQLERKDAEIQTVTSSVTAKKDEEITAIRTKLMSSLEKLEISSKKSLDEEKKNSMAKQGDYDKQSILLKTLQDKLNSVSTAPPVRSPEDVSYINDLNCKVQQLTDAKLVVDGEVTKLQHQNKCLLQYMEVAVDTLGSDTPDFNAVTIDPIIEAADGQTPETRKLMKTLFEMMMFLKSQLAELTSLSSNYEAKIKLLVKKQKEEIKQERVACEAVLKGLEDQLLRKKDELNKLQLEMKQQQVQLSAIIDKNTITQQYVEDSSLIKKLQKLLAEANEQITLLTQEQKVLTSQVAEFRHAFLDADEKCRDALFLNRVLTEESARAKEANDDLRKKMSDLTQTYLS